MTPSVFSNQSRGFLRIILCLVLSCFFYVLNHAHFFLWIQRILQFCTNNACFKLSLNKSATLETSWLKCLFTNCGKLTAHSDHPWGVSLHFTLSRSIILISQWAASVISYDNQRESSGLLCSPSATSDTAEEAVTRPSLLRAWTDQLLSLCGLSERCSPSANSACTLLSWQTVSLVAVEAELGKQHCIVIVRTWPGFGGCWRLVCCLFSSPVRGGSAARREFTMWGSLRTRGIMRPVEKTCLPEKMSQMTSKY